MVHFPFSDAMVALPRNDCLAAIFLDAHFQGYVFESRDVALSERVHLRILFAKCNVLRVALHRKCKMKFFLHMQV